jgi:hypothetical protein
MAKSKNNSSPDEEQDGINEENAQGDEAQGASLDQNSDAEQQGEGEGNPEDNADTSTEGSANGTEQEEGEKPSESSTETEKTDSTDEERDEHGEPDPKLPVGTILTVNGKEFVKVGYPNEWLPKEKTIPPEGVIQGGANPPPDPAASIPVFSESRKGITVHAASGQPIVFDDEGKATVNEVDALYLKQCPGFVVG